jgi:phosphodiesterase/alkaline phosphatase D-like protein
MRDQLVTTVGAACLCAVVVASADARSARPPSPTVKWVWSGAVTARSAVVKARVSVPGAPVRLGVTGGQDAAAPGRMLEARSDADGIATFTLDRLEATTRYDYRVKLDGAPPLAGTFRTFGDGPWNFRIAFASCAATGSNSGVFDAIRAAGPDLFVHMGDLHYRNISANAPERFRRAYDEVMRSATQGRLYRSVPIAYTWDDHDFGGNNANGSSASRPAALAVYRQFVPHYPLESGETTGIFQAFGMGRVRVIITDARSQRTSNWGAPPSRTILGARQLQWLKDQLAAAASAPLVVWVNTVPWIARERSGSDDWGSYAAERRDIANHIQRLGLTQRLVMLSGDAHMVALDDGTHSNYATEAGQRERGFVVMHAAPLDRLTTEKGGPYSHGVSRRRGQFGLFEVTDDGATLRVELSGRDRRGGAIPGMRLVLACAEMRCVPLSTPHDR